MSTHSSLSKRHHYAEDDHHRITPNMTAYLKATQPWARFISVIMFLSSGLCALIGVAIFFTDSSAGVPILFGAVYLVLAVFALPLGVQLLGFARTIASMDEEQPMFPMEEALRRLGSFWKMVGIYTLGFMLVFLIVFITQVVALMK